MSNYNVDNNFNNLQSTVVYGVFINSDMPTGITGISSNTNVNQYAYGQFNRDLTVFGNMYSNNITGFTKDTSGNISGINGNVSVASNNLIVSRKFIVMVLK